MSIPLAANLKILKLNGTNVTMSIVRNLLAKTPELKELHLTDNASVISLRKMFPNVKSFFMSENPIRSTVIELNADSKNYLNGIRMLCLNRCLIDDWSSIECLANICTLEDLRLASIPLWNTLKEDEYFHLAVARIPQLKFFNGSLISEDQRHQSEVFFIRYYVDCETKPKVFARLVERHGLVGVGENRVNYDMTPKRHALVVVKCEETGYSDSVKIRLAQTVMELMQVFEKLTSISAERMRLFHIPASSHFPTELRLRNQNLHSMRIDDGDQFLVRVGKYLL
ncbi:unnamed protein product [Gongylonema pulchrum]|uniref:Ubiquitin-like domain-containing protein n=1 Tax=Gongylonema pulchrum TaxID=637853 RepID=A0A183D3G7_9BILA|nr:unnamed protein product [Gongylonema pulchrum]